MKLTAAICCLIGFSAAVSKRRAALYDYAFEQYDALEGIEHRSLVARSTLLPGANDHIPLRQQASPKAEVINETAAFFPEKGSIRSKLRYGPFEMDPMNQHESMVDYLQINAQMPCKDCTITFMQASLEYENGTYANANTSAWLHHVVLINLKHPDTVCGTNFYGRGQRWFASGNERTRASFSLDGKIPAGYYIGSSDIMVMETELMNQAIYNQTVMLTITYEWISGSPSDFFSLRPIWMDIGGCHIASDMPVKSKPQWSDDTLFSYTSPTYTSDFAGAYIGMGAHLHDGGINVEITADLKTQLCNSVAGYGETPGYVDAPGTSMTVPMAPMFNPMTHISSMSFCYAPIDKPMIANGTTLAITANYDLNEHMPMLTLDGDFDDIMGISVIYAAVNITQAQLISYVGNTTLPLAETPVKTGMGGMSMMMPAGGDDDDDSGDSNSDSMGGGMMADMPTCVPQRDSPGSITLTNLDTTDDDTMNALLMAIMCDTCLQAWSQPYARYLWYGVVVVVFLFGAARIATWQTHLARKAQASQVRPDVYLYAAPRFVVSAWSGLTRISRLITYRQFGPVSLPSIFKLPPLSIVLMILGYFGFLLGLQFTHASTGDLQTLQFLSVRAGWLSVAQLPLIVLLSTKRNFVTMLTAVTYERLNILHRWTARGLLMTGLMHFGFQWQGWRNAGVVQYELSDSCVPTGAASLALVLWMNLSTLAPFRNMAYELFVLQHLITFFGTIIAIAYHIPSTAPYALTYVYITAALYLVTKLFQMFMIAIQRKHRATLTTVSTDVTKVTVSPSPFKTWKTGSFARISIPRLGLVQSHPATIASTPTSHNGDLVFYLLRRRGFTKTIARPEKHAGDYKAILDGPYGGSQHDLAAFDTSVLIAGSTGITFTLSLLLDLAQRSAHVCLPLRRLVFVWSTREEDLVKGLQNEIASSVDALLIAGIDIEAFVHVTGTNTVSSIFSGPPRTGVEEIDDRSLPESGSDHSGSKGEAEKKPMRATIRTLSEKSSNSGVTKDAAPHIHVAAGRADLDHVLAEARQVCDGEMGVAVCGPLSMSKQVRNKVAAMQFGAQSKASGTYLHVEGFSW